MADDQNNLKGKKAPNSTLSASIAEREKHFLEGTAQERGARLRLEQTKLMNSLLEEGARFGAAQRSSEEQAALEAMIAKNYNTINRLIPRVALYEETRKDRFVNGVALDVGSFFDSQRTLATSVSRSSAVLTRARSLINAPTEELETRLNTIQNRIEAQRQGAINEIPNLLDPNTSQAAKNRMGVFAQRAGILTENAGLISAALRMQRQLGLDPDSRFQDIAKSADVAGRILGMNKAEQSVKNMTGLGALSGAELKAKEVEAANRLLEAFSKLTDGTEKSKEKIKELEEAAAEAKKELGDIGDVKRAGGGGSRNVGAWNAAAGYAAIVGMAGDAYKSMFVGQRMQEVANVASYANIENQKYNMYQAASQGDVASQLLLSQWRASENFGRSIKSRTGIGDTMSGIGWGSAKLLGGGAAIAAGASGTVATLGGAAVPGGMLASAGGAAFVSGGLDIATNISALARGTNTGQAYGAGTAADMEARRQILAVSASQLQGLRDFGVGLGTAAISMGGRGVGFLDRMTDANRGNEFLMRARHGMPNMSMLQRMAEARISPEQMTQMALMGVQSMGSTFNENQIFAARGLERSGFGTMGENMQRMAALSGAGVNNPQYSLASVLEGAVSKGMDSSKAISMLTDNTAIMAKQSFAAAAGLDVAGAAATLLGANIDPKTGNQEYQVERAMTAQQIARGITTNTDVSFSGMVNTARISRKTGLGGDDAIFAAKLSTEELKALQGKTDGEIKAYMLQKGINPNNTNLQPKELVNELLDVSRMTLMEAKGAGWAFGSGQLRESLAEKAKANVPYEKLSDEEKALLGKLGGGNITGKEFYGTGLGISAQNDPNAVGTVQKGLKGEGASDLQKMFDDMRTQGFKQLSAAADEATKGLKTAADALKALGALAKETESATDAGYEGTAKDAASKSAESFGRNTAQFERSVNLFSNAVNVLAQKAGLSTSSSEVPLVDKNKSPNRRFGVMDKY